MCRACPRRKVITMMQKIVGFEINISATQISRCVAKLNECLEARRNQAFGVNPYVVFDTCCEKVRTSS